MLKHFYGKKRILAIILCFMMLFSQSSMTFADESSSDSSSEVVASDNTGDNDINPGDKTEEENVNEDIILEEEENVNEDVIPGENEIINEEEKPDSKVEFTYDPQPQSEEDVWNAVYAWAAMDFAPEVAPHWQYEVGSDLMPAGFYCKFVEGGEYLTPPYYTVAVEVRTLEGYDPTCTIEWTGGGTISPTDKSKLDITPSINQVGDKIAKYLITFKLGEDQTAAPGEIEIRVPMYIFKDRGTDSIPPANKGTYSLPLSMTQSGDTGFYYEVDGDEIVIRNFATFMSGSTFTCEINYSLPLPSTIDGGYTKQPENTKVPGYTNDEIKASYAVTSANGAVATGESNKLSVSVHTSATINNLRKTGTKYESWNNTWGTAPDSLVNPADYFYIMWSMTYTSRSNCTQPYKVTITDNNTEGILLGVHTSQSQIVDKTNKRIHRRI